MTDEQQIDHENKFDIESFQGTSTQYNYSSRNKKQENNVHIIMIHIVINKFIQCSYIIFLRLQLIV
jgi:hypothetical protein